MKPSPHKRVKGADLMRYRGGPLPSEINYAQREKTVKAWAIVNKHFEERAELHPSLYTARVYLTEQKAKDHIDELRPKFCAGCGRKNKREELKVKILPITITYSLPTPKRSKPRGK